MDCMYNGMTRNELIAKYRLEAKEKWECWSPYRIDQYVAYRLAGKSPYKAIKLVRSVGIKHTNRKENKMNTTFIRVLKGTLSDGSHVYNVDIRQDDQHITIGCFDKESARNFVDATRDAFLSYTVEDLKEI